MMFFELGVYDYSAVPMNFQQAFLDWPAGKTQEPTRSRNSVVSFDTVQFAAHCFMHDTTQSRLALE